MARITNIARRLEARLPAEFGGMLYYVNRELGGQPTWAIEYEINGARHQLGPLMASLPGAIRRAKNILYVRFVREQKALAAKGEAFWQKGL